MPRKNSNAGVVARKPRRSAAVTETATPTRTAAEDKLWKALRANPGATTAEVAMQAGIGKSTAGKILATWNTDGSVDRTSGTQGGGGRRGADRWTIPAAEAPADADLPTDTDGATSGTGARTDAAPTDESPSSVDVDETQPAAAAAADSADTTTKAPRLGKGALRGMVEDYLRAHPGEQFSPNAIGKALDRSSGAVNNALEKLVTDGYAEKTKEKPKRFAIKPDK